MYALVIIAAILRIMASLLTDARGSLLLGAAAFWIGAFGLFAVRYGSFLVRPRLP